METMIFKVRPTKEAEFKKIVKKFNRCLKASGMTEIQPVLLGECDIDIKVGSTNFHYSVKGNEYHLTFPDNVLGMKGYRFIGEYRKLDGKWHRTMHSSDIKDELEVCESNMRCDHCGRNIRNRNGYFFFRDPEEKLTVVGSTCVDAFLGMDVRGLLEALGDATEFERSCGSPDLDKEYIGVGLDSFIGMVSDATDGFTKWVTKKQDNSTSALLKSWLGDIFFGRGKVVSGVANAGNIASKCRDYWNKQYKFDDFAVNSRKALQGDFVPLHWAGIAGFAIFKAMSDVNPAPKQVNAVAGSFVGVVGCTYSKPLVPVKCYPFTGRNGNPMLAIHLDDADGNHYLCFNGKKSVMDAVRNACGKGTRIPFTFKIKEHLTERGQKVNKIVSLA